ncbi:MAG: 23S rRNA (uracil(1939)-C(5))-methyltransferase RlmD [Clostridia bacterium]|nr:23S rRNA (uracil(1939)-C(5))-methyltransferase RlmD [Clostridia bacterium]
MANNPILVKNQCYPMTVRAVNNLGNGVGEIEGMVTFVRGAVTGDEIITRIIKTNRSFCIGRVEQLITPSSLRTPDPCTAPLSCGGCAYRGLAYTEELRLKREDIVHAFRTAGLPDAVIEPVRTTGQTTACRNKAQYPFANTPDGVELGFYAAKSHRLVPTDGCVLQPPAFGEIARTIRSFAREKSIPAYDEITGQGLLRHLYLREGKASGEILVCLVINGNTIPCANELCGLLTEHFPNIAGILLNHNTARTNLILGDRYTTLWGRDYLMDTLCGLDFAIRPAAFYQVNHDGAELLYSIAREKACLCGTERLLDLYCGIGTIGLSMADRAGKLIGIEIVEDAVRCAVENAARNGVPNARFFCGDASSAEGLLAPVFAECPDYRPDVVILDPPRKGSTPELLSYLARLNTPRIVYVSCDPATLARDAVFLCALGYTMSPVTPGDMVPRTGHCECVCSFSKPHDV